MLGRADVRNASNPLTAGAGFTWYEKYFSKLMLYTPDFSAIQGELAESWEINEDATQYTIHVARWRDSGMTVNRSRRLM